MAELKPIKQDKQAAIEWLVEYFPNAFFTKAREIKPLKLGIYEDIMDFYERLDSPPFSKKLIREVLNHYSSSKAYLKCQKANTPRIDLFGYEFDTVTEEQAQYAETRYNERYNPKNDLRQTSK